MNKEFKSVKINEKYSFYRSSDCWVLLRAQEMKDKTKPQNYTKTYYQRLDQVLNKVVDISMEDCEDFYCLCVSIEKAKKEILGAVESMNTKAITQKNICT